MTRTIEHNEQTAMIFKNIYVKLPPNFYTKMRAEKFVKNPQLLHFNDGLAKLLDIDRASFENNLEKWIEGEVEGFDPLAMVYSGHQFGHYVPRLGDGRALLLTQIVGKDGKLYDLQLKGSGLTPYSRMGDGRAVLRSSIREYLCSEAMYNLGIPTTRALALIATNENVLREEIEPTAMIIRVARSHIRFGHFEYFYYSNQHESLKILADHVIENYFLQINSAQNKYEEFLQQVVTLTAAMIAKWQAVGFCHGVMNSDNMSILGDTIDYGPFGFLENYDPSWICNHSDHFGRYAYQEQPKIAAWNLYALAFALQPLVSLERSGKIVESFFAQFQENYSALMRQKIAAKRDEIWQELLQKMQKEKSDYTLTFANLSKKNPRYILRNWVLQKVIEDAKNSDISRLNEVFEMIKNPFTKNQKFEKYAKSAPQKYRDLCVSCSS